MKRPPLRYSVVVAAVVTLVACGSGDTESELIAAGKSKLAQKDVRAALIHFKNALGKNPDSAQARLLLGRTLLMSGDPAAALIELERARETLPAEQVDPEIARALLAAGNSSRVVADYATVKLSDSAAHADLKSVLAAAYADLGDTAKARDSAAAALTAKPGFGPAMTLLARLDLAAGNTDAALQQLDHVLTADPGSETASLLKADILQQSRTDAEGALQTLRKSLEVNGGSARLHAAVIDILIRQGKRDLARAELDKLKVIAPTHAETMNLQAVLAFLDQNYLACVEFTDRLIAAKLGGPSVLVLAGAANLRLQRYSTAEGQLGQALKLAPTDGRARQLLARTYLKTGQPEKAIEALKPVIDAADADATSLTIAGEAFLQAGDGRQSDQAFQRAVRAAPNSAAVRASLASAQITRGDSAAAIGQLEAIAKADSSVQTDVALVAAKLQQRDYKGALAVIDRLEKQLPDQAFPVATRGLVLFLQGDKAGSAASLEKALKIQPRYFPAVARLAALDLEAGQADKARQRLKDLIKADPKNTRARVALADIDARIGGTPESAIVAQLRDATKADPTDPAPHLTLVDRLLGTGQPQDALAAAQDASTALPNNLQVMQALGRAQVAAGDSRGAVASFKRLTGLQSRNVTYQVQLAEALTADKDRVAAALALRKAVEIEPENVLAQRGLALLAAMDLRHTEGVAIARAMQQRRPKDAAGYALEGEIEALRKNWAASIPAFKAAYQRDKSSAFAVLLHRALSDGEQRAEADRLAADWRREHAADMGFVHYLGERASASGDWAAAETQFRTVLAAQPRNAGVMNNVAWLLARQRKPGATAMAEEALRLQPDNPSLLDTLSLAQDADNQTAKALETQKRAVGLSPKNGAMRLRLAQLLIKEGKKSEARQELENLGKLGPAFARQDEVQAMLKAL